ncbi:MAG: hypothetical protein ACI4SH_05190, partial [Candidatus Scatosoma sp.]
MNVEKSVAAERIGENAAYATEGQGGKLVKPTDEFLREYARLQPLYSGALKTACARFEILDDEFSLTHGHDPIHHIESRLKTPESCFEKLKRRG